MKPPRLSLLVKLGSIVVHAQEVIGPGAHPFDLAALRSLVRDTEVEEWIAMMAKEALVPVPRSTPSAKGV